MPGMETKIKVQLELFRSRIREYKINYLKIFASSSFQSHSIPMLHVISRIDNSIPVYFLDTGFHFPETLIYKQKITELLNLNVVSINSPVLKKMQRDEHNRFLFSSDPDYCCYLNKTMPMENVLAEYDIWINGVRRAQNSHRSSFELEMEGPKDTVRFHPMLDWSDEMIWAYFEKYDLPKHPLESQGYFSIGCQPCTRKFIPSKSKDQRNARWVGTNKSECGLHTELIKKKK